MPSQTNIDNGYSGGSVPASPVLPLPTNYNEATCYYVLLGLQKSANPSQDEIKKAYKRMALRYHPDKNSNDGDEVKKLAEKLFKLVARAYEVLSNTSLKSTYDRHGHRGISAMNGNEDRQSSSSRGSAFGSGGASGSHGGFGFDPFGDMFGFSGMPNSHARSSGGQGGAQTFRSAGGEGIPMFAFHDPFDIFRQVFGAMNMMGGMGMAMGSRGGMNPNDNVNGRRRAADDRGMESLYYDSDDMHELYGTHGHSGMSNRAFQQQGSFGNNFGTTQHQRQRQAPQGHGMMMPHMMMDPFGFGAFGPMGMGMGMGGMGGMMDMHQQMMMGGGSNGFTSSTSFSSVGGRAGTVSSSTSTTTRIVNGQQVTRTVRRTTDANGHTTEDVQERTDPIGSSSHYGGGRLGW